MRTPREHQKLQKFQNKGAKSVVLIGANLESQELASTIRMEYPKVQVKIVDPNRESHISRTLGKSVAEALFKLHKNKGVTFSFGRGLASYQISEEDERRVSALKTKDDKIHEADVVVMFPNNYEANTNWVSKRDVFEDSKCDSSGRILAEPDCTLGDKVLFGVGSCASQVYPGTAERLVHEVNHREAINQGKVGAFNVLGLGIPYYMTPLSYTKHYNKYLQKVGNINFYDDVHIEGDLDNFDFVAIYSMGGKVLGAVATPSKENYANVIGEALRYRYMPSMGQLKDNAVRLKSILYKLKMENKFRCFNEEIYKIRFEPIPELILWRERDRMGDTYWNPKEDGLHWDTSEMKD